MNKTSMNKLGKDDFCDPEIEIIPLQSSNVLLFGESGPFDGDEEPV